MVDILIASGDLGQAMLVLSQSIASIEQFSDQFSHLKVEANFQLAYIKFKRGETIAAYEDLTQAILPYALEHGSKMFKLRVLSLLSKVCL